MVNAAGGPGSPQWQQAKGGGMGPTGALRPYTGPLPAGSQLAQTGGSTKAGKVQATIPTANTNNTRGLRSASFEPVEVRFAQPGVRADAGALVEGLRSKYVSGGKVGSRQLEAMQDDIDRMFNNPAQRAALIERYGLNSADNQKALVAVGACESGDNGDMGETMTVTMNRALLRNMVAELTDRTPDSPSPRTSIMDVVNEPGQYESRSRVQTIMNGGDTSQNHYANFSQQGRAVLSEVLGGKTSFRHNASGTYFFRQASFPVGNDFTIGKHKFSDRLSADTSMVQAMLHDQKAIRWQ